VQDLNDLQYFAQVVRRGGFSAASRATGEPKSKLSKRVAQLERDLGVCLLERSSAGLLSRRYGSIATTTAAAEEELAWLRTGRSLYNCRPPHRSAPSSRT
jgi:DNA-binding transcriptional LysR family regulator